MREREILIFGIPGGSCILVFFWGQSVNPCKIMGEVKCKVLKRLLKEVTWGERGRERL